MSLLPASNLPVNGFAQEVGAVLLLRENGVDPRQRSLGEAGRHLLIVDLDSAHAPLVDRGCGNRQRLHFSDISYLDAESDITYLEDIRLKRKTRSQKMNLTTLPNISGDKFWNIEVGGKAVARLQKPNRAFGGWYVTSTADWEVREHFTSKEAALAYAATL